MLSSSVNKSANLSIASFQALSPFSFEAFVGSLITPFHLFPWFGNPQKTLGPFFFDPIFVYFDFGSLIFGFLILSFTTVLHGLQGLLRSQTRLHVRHKGFNKLFNIWPCQLTKIKSPHLHTFPSSERFVMNHFAY